MNITVISEYISAEVYGSLADQEIKWLLTDSRSLSFPAGSLFFAWLIYRYFFASKKEI